MEGLHACSPKVTLKQAEIELSHSGTNTLAVSPHSSNWDPESFSSWDVSKCHVGGKGSVINSV